jgi:hypothetical protein
MSDRFRENPQGTVLDPPDLMEYTGSFRQFIVDSIRARYNGRYWIDIYDAASARRLIQLRGEFHGDKPDYFQGKAKWLNGSLYVLPLEPRGMRRLLICDVDAAAKASGVAESDAAVPLERAKPYFNHSRSTYQMRFLDPETPQARITGFQDQPVYRPGTNQIETVKVTALLEVQTPGRYSLRLDLANMQEHGEADLDRGNARITIPFAAARLREGGVGGPFRITWAHLTRQVGDGQKEADNRHDASKFAGMNDSGQLTSDKYGDRIDAATEAYSLNSLGALLYFTGENSAAPTRGSGSEPDRLEVRIGLHAEDTDCRGYGFVNGAQASNGLVSGAADRKTLLMTFTGKGIVDSAGYRIQHVGVRCGGHWIQAASIDIPIGK